MYFADNLKFLRKRKNRSQDETSGALGVKRTTWSAYEIGNAEPGFETLLKISDYFKIPIDILLKEKLSDWSESKIRELEIKNDIDVFGKKLRVVVTTVDSDNNSNIELVPVKAKAGYTGGYADPDYISVLPTFKLPFLSKEKKYRTFPISGDSMPPVVHGSWVTAEYVDNWTLIKSGTPCIVITQDEGIVFKIVHNHINSKNCLLLCSTNPAYEPYEVPIEQILEVWSFVNYITSELTPPNISQQELTNSVLNLQREMAEVKNNLK
ncbi:MAG TPA: helix-turn-helix domain-containing protein [Bacteroidia bacterium]